MSIRLSKISFIRILLALMLIISQFTDLEAQWIKQSPIPTAMEIRDVCFISADTGWIFGSDGLVMQTTDAGNTWIDKSVDSYSDIYVGLFRDSCHGWVALTDYYQENDAEIFGTSDGGNTWTLQYVNNTCGIEDLAFINSNAGWALAYYSLDYPDYSYGNILLKTIDGGQNWFVLDTLDQAYYQELDFINDTVGFIAGTDTPNLMKTLDGGLTWQVSPHVSDAGLTDVFFTDVNNGYTCGNNFYSTHNGGAGWSSTYCYHSYKVDMYDADNGWTITIDKIYKIANGGENVEYQFTPDKSLLVDISAPDSLSAYVIGRNVCIYSTSDGGNDWHEISNGTQNNLGSVFFLNENDGWAGGANHTILHTHDGGDHWIYSELSASYGVIDIQFINADTGWLVCEGIYRSSDGGENWGCYYSDYKLTDLYFLNSSTGWCVGENGLFRSSDNSGFNWVERNSGTDKDLYAVFFVNEMEGWIGGEGLVKKTTDGGDTWTESYVSFDDYIKIQFFNENAGYILGNHSLLKTYTGGEYWHIITPAGNYYFTDMCFIDQNTGFVFGDHDLFKTTDGGANWESDPEIPNLVTYPNAICFVDEQKGWIVGSDGVILHTVTGGTVAVDDPGDEAESSLYNIFPNPSVDIFNISFKVESSEGVEIGIYNLHGIRVFYKKETGKNPGSYSCVWDPGNLPSGIYLCKIRIGDYSDTGKIVFIK